MRFAVGDIDKDVYSEASRELTLNITKAEKELEEAENKFSNLSKYIESSITIASIALLRTSTAGFEQKEQDKSEDLSCLVAEGGLEPPTSGL